MDGAISQVKTKPAGSASGGARSRDAGTDFDGALQDAETVASVWRLTIAACVLTYIAVFFVALQTGSAPDTATLKGGIAMATIGVLGSVAISTVGTRDSSEKAGSTVLGDGLADLAASVPASRTTGAQGGNR